MWTQSRAVVEVRYKRILGQNTWWHMTTYTSSVMAIEVALASPGAQATPA